MAKSTVRRMIIEPVSNGVMSEVHTQKPRGGKGGGGMYDDEMEKTFHPTSDHFVEHFGRTMGGLFPKQNDQEPSTVMTSKDAAEKE